MQSLYMHKVAFSLCILIRYIRFSFIFISILLKCVFEPELGEHGWTEFHGIYGLKV